MPREIVHIQVGQCGNQIGLKFWEYICGEHGVSGDGKFKRGDFSGLKGEELRLAEKEEKEKLDKMGVYFQQTGDDRFTARGVLVDLEPGILDKIKGSSHGNVFAKDAAVHAASGAGNNWAKGHYTEGGDIIDEVMDKVRKEAEACDCVQGFQICHSLGGGTGSGLGTLILLKPEGCLP